MEQVNKEREEREKLLAKIKSSINKNPEKTPEPKLKITKDGIIDRDERDERDEIIEKSKTNNLEKVNKAKSLYEVFEDNSLMRERDRSQAKAKRTRGNINLGNVYDSDHF